MHFKNDFLFRDESLRDVKFFDKNISELQKQKAEELKLAEARLKELENDVDIAVKRFRKQILLVEELKKQIQ